MTNNPLGTAATLTTQSGAVSCVRLAKLAAKTRTDVGRLPHTVKILLENNFRHGGILQMVRRRLTARDSARPGDTKAIQVLTIDNVDVKGRY